jgi:hypothetical protein
MTSCRQDITQQRRLEQRGQCAISAETHSKVRSKWPAVLYLCWCEVPHCQCQVERLIPLIQPQLGCGAAPAGRKL